MVTAALSPELILVAGDVTSAWKRFAPIIEKNWMSYRRQESPRASCQPLKATLPGFVVLLLSFFSGTPPVNHPISHEHLKMPFGFGRGRNREMLITIFRGPEQE
jgi:hypothetical protein